jgi:CHAD domain-containing protein
MARSTQQPQSNPGIALREWRHAVSRARSDPADRKAIHAFRVATRRLLAIAAAMAPAGSARLGRMEEAVRPAFRAAGRVRDAQLCSRSFRAQATRYPVAADAARAIQRQLPGRLKRLGKQLERLPDAELRRDWQSLYRHAGDPQACSGAALARAARRQLTAHRQLDRPANLHRYRVSLKRVRYALEWLGPAAGDRRWRQGLQDLARLQAALGQVSDGQAMRAWLEELPRLTGRPAGDFARLGSHLERLQLNRLRALQALPRARAPLSAAKAAANSSRRSTRAGHGRLHFRGRRPG